MGPLADFRTQNTGANERPIRIKWIDNGEDNKQKLRTNNSEDDLVCKADEDQVKPMTFHRQADKQPAKPAIKAFKLSLTDVTGVLHPPSPQQQKLIDSVKVPTPDMFYKKSLLEENGGETHIIVDEDVNLDDEVDDEEEDIVDDDVSEVIEVVGAGKQIKRSEIQPFDEELEGSKKISKVQITATSNRP